MAEQGTKNQIDPKQVEFEGTWYFPDSYSYRKALEWRIQKLRTENEGMSIIVEAVSNWKAEVLAEHQRVIMELKHRLTEAETKTAKIRVRLGTTQRELDAARRMVPTQHVCNCPPPRVASVSSWVCGACKGVAKWAGPATQATIAENGVEDG